MSEEITAVQSEIKNHGWRVTFAGMGVNLALGILYTWSVISKRVPDDWGWNENDKSLPYMLACLVFSVIMVPAGRMQDKIGPRRRGGYARKYGLAGGLAGQSTCCEPDTARNGSASDRGDNGSS
ncbi:hypothetical protein ES703_54915 [subsurface metagenome]